MNVIITMAGLGSRFQKAGYEVPKYMINAKGKTLFEWSMESLTDYNAYVNKYVFVVRKEDNSSDFIKEKCKNYNIKNVEIIQLDELTDGQATTALLALQNCNDDESIMIYNIDTYVETGELKYNDIDGDGYIPCFNAPGEHWSFVKTDENGKVIEIREKQRISDNCTLGAYYFKSAKLYKEIYNEYYSDDTKIEKKEKYIAPMYNYMLTKGMKITMNIIDNTKVHVLGTPEELEIFING